MRILNETPFAVAPLLGKVRPPAHSMSVIVKGTFALAADAAAQALPAEEQRYPCGEQFRDDDDRLELVYPSDFAYYKPRADLLLIGSCHAPAGRPVSRCRVTYGVGDHRRTLAVIGPRHWRPGMSAISEPEPFTAIPLSWSRAFGGAGFAHNPVGRGIDKQPLADGTEAVSLPNLEDPDRLIAASAARPPPAAFGPVHPGWKARRDKVGSYGGDWLARRWPWFPDDFDWSYFNAAPEPMQVAGYLRGDEALFFENLHPEHAEYNARLPGIRIRCFLEAPGDGDRRLAELSMRLDTAWVNMDTEEMILVWRGLAEIPGDRLEDLGNLLVAGEHLAEPARSDAAIDALRQRLVAAEEGEEPEPPAPPQPAVVVEDEESVLEQMRRQLKDELGLDLNELMAGDGAPAPPVDPAQLVADLTGLGVDAAEAEQIAATLAEPDEDGDAELTAERVIACHARGEAVVERDLSGIRLREARLAGIVLRGCILAAADLGGSDLSGADLAGVTLAGAFLADARLDAANLAATDLTGADLRGASLAGAKLAGASFNGCDLRGADLSGAGAAEAVDFAAADLRGAVLDDVVLESCDFAGARLDDARLRRARLVDCDFGGAVGERVDFSAADLGGARFWEGARLPGAVLVGVRAPDSQWEGADLTAADFSRAQLTRADFTGAGLRRARFTLARLREANLERADLTAAALDRSDVFQGSFEQANLTAADLRGANLYEAEFLDATLEGTELAGAIVAMTKLARS